MKFRMKDGGREEIKVDKIWKLKEEMKIEREKNIWDLKLEIREGLERKKVNKIWNLRGEDGLQSRWNLKFEI